MDIAGTILALQMEHRSKYEPLSSKVIKTKRGLNKKQGRTSSDEWAWKKMPPKGSESKTKTAKDKTYNWCNNHQLWVLCKPSKCPLKK